MQNLQISRNTSLSLPFLISNSVSYRPGDILRSFICKTQYILSVKTQINIISLKPMASLHHIKKNDKTFTNLWTPWTTDPNKTSKDLLHKSEDYHTEKSICFVLSHLINFKLSFDLQRVST